MAEDLGLERHEAARSQGDLDALTAHLQRRPAHDRGEGGIVATRRHEHADQRNLAVVGLVDDMRLALAIEGMLAEAVEVESLSSQVLRSIWTTDLPLTGTASIVRPYARLCISWASSRSSDGVRRGWRGRWRDQSATGDCRRRRRRTRCRAASRPRAPSFRHRTNGRHRPARRSRRRGTGQGQQGAGDGGSTLLDLLMRIFSPRMRTSQFVAAHTAEPSLTAPQNYGLSRSEIQFSEIY